MVFEYTRNENGDFICTHCKDYVVSKEKQSTMNMHYHAKHSGDLPHGCTHCTRRFLSRLSLEQHIQTNHMDRTQRAEVADVFTCPIEGCAYTAYTAGNRRIHFLRKHCVNEVNAILERNGDSYTCLQCTHVYNSSTAFYYHVAKCLPANTLNLQEIM